MGAYLTEPVTEIHTNTGSSKGVRFTSCEMQGWRKNMEDSSIAELKLTNKSGKIYSLFGVFDGHGGPEVSKFVAKHFVEEFQKDSCFDSGQIAKALENTFRKMDELMRGHEGIVQLNEIKKAEFGLATTFDDRLGASVGCTANVVVFDDRHIFTANSGDSRAALSRAGKLVVLSEDHKPEVEAQKLRIERAGGNIMNGRVEGGLNLTRALGDFDYKSQSHLPYHEQMVTCQPEVRVVSRHPDDQFIIMGCDGIWQRYVSDSQHMIDYLSSQRNMCIDPRIFMQNMLKGMLAQCSSSETGCDNMTAILIEFTNS